MHFPSLKDLVCSPAVNIPGSRGRGADESSRTAVRGKKIYWKPHTNSGKPWKQGTNKLFTRDTPLSWNGRAGLSRGQCCCPLQATVIISPSPPELWDSLSHFQLCGLCLILPPVCPGSPDTGIISTGQCEACPLTLAANHVLWQQRQRLWRKCLCWHHCTDTGTLSLNCLLTTNISMPAT